jgi:hypothetical protein
MSLHKIATVLNEWAQDIRAVFVEEDTLISMYSSGAFVGILHWRIEKGDPLTMVVSFVKSEELNEIQADLRLYLIRTLSAILPADVRITGLKI